MFEARDKARGKSVHLDEDPENTHGRVDALSIHPELSADLENKLQSELDQPRIGSRVRAAYDSERRAS